jgi:hypothetical protein
MYQLYGSVPLKRQMNLRHRFPDHRLLSKQAIAEYEKTIQLASEDPSCMECRVDLANGFHVVIHKLPSLVGMAPVKRRR